MKIYLTTLGRVNKQDTLVGLPAALQRQVIMVVQAHEYAAHRDRWGGVVAEVRALPEHVRTLGPTRRAIYNWKEDERIVLLDDDLTFTVRRNAGDWRLFKPTEQEIMEMMITLEHTLGTYAHAGIGAREGHNRVEQDAVETTRYMRVLGYNTRMADVEHGRIDGMSDFDVNLQLLKKGLPSLVLYHWAQNQPGTQAPGGCAINRTHDTHNAEIDKMLHWHSPFVKERLKQNKTGGDFGTRRELTIYWKKALEAGLAEKDARA